MNSPFNQEQVELLNRILPTLTEIQKVWLTGYLSACQQSPSILGTPEELVAQLPGGEHRADNIKRSDRSLRFTDRQCSKASGKTGKTLEGKGFQVTVTSMSDFKPNNLKKIQNLLIIVSTYGEGDAPDNALSFHEFLHGKRAPKLDQLNFAVLALGDSSYEKFCQTGKEFDQKLAELGGTRIYPRFDCDLDYDEAAAEWLKGVTDSLSEGQDGRA